jgi:hypothetical protein
VVDLLELRAEGLRSGLAVLIIAIMISGLLLLALASGSIKAKADEDYEEDAEGGRR